MNGDPVTTDPGLYRVVLENQRVRVLEYRDRPGDATSRHAHPDSVMVPLTDFRRRVAADGRSVDVALRAGEVRWLDAQEHAGENTGDTASHALFIELKQPAGGDPSAQAHPLGPGAPG